MTDQLPSDAQVRNVRKQVLTGSVVTKALPFALLLTLAGCALPQMQERFEKGATQLEGALATANVLTQVARERIANADANKDGTIDWKELIGIVTGIGAVGYAASAKKESKTANTTADEAWVKAHGGEPTIVTPQP